MRSLFPGIVLCACAAAESPADIEKIMAYQGTWKIEAEHFNTRFSRAAKESSILRNDCWRSGGFYVCDQFVNGESKDLIVFTYDGKDDTYGSYSVPAGGGEGGSGKLIVKGNVWPAGGFPRQGPRDGDGEGAREEAGVIHARWEPTWPTAKSHGGAG